MQLNGDIIVLDEGEILQSGTAKDVFENPENIKVAEITNDPAMNVIKGSIDSNKIILNENVQFDIPEHVKTIRAGTYHFGIRASDMILDDNGFDFNVDIAEISGSETFLHLHQNELNMVLLIEEVRNFNDNDKVKINFNLNKLYVFDEKGNLLFSPFKMN
jgi:glycerol transport system ATP-binding protein